MIALGIGPVQGKLLGRQSGSLADVDNRAIFKIQEPKMHHMIHKSGEGALVRPIQGRPDIVHAQFDRLSHEHSNGWHVYPTADFARDDDSPEAA